METWPTTSVISRVIREAPPADPAKFLGVRYLPLNTRDFTNTEAIVYDRYGAMQGMIPAHDLNTDPKLIKSESVGTYSLPTGYWKGTSRVNERDILRVRNLGTRYQELQVDRLVTRALKRVKLATEVRMEWLRWQALNDALQGVTDDGVPINVDFDLPTVVEASVDWDEYATADPIADIQDQLMEFRGTGVSRVELVVNSQVGQWLSRNESFRDLYGNMARPGDFAPNMIAARIMELVGMDLLKAVNIYDEGYRNNGSWSTFVPDDRAFLIGTAMETAPADNDFGAEDMLGEFASTPAIRDGLDDVSPGMFAISEDHTREGNPYFDAIGGIYGMPAIYHNTWVRRINTKVS